MPPEQPLQTPTPPPEHHWKKYIFLTLSLLIILGGLVAYAYYSTQTTEQTQELTQEQELIEQKLLAQGIALPPDPGEAGKQTLEGIDSDNDGVRDDVQRWIALNYSDSVKVQEVLRQSAIATQRAIINTDATEETRRAILAAELATVRCLTFLRGADFSYDASGVLDDLLVNTEARMVAYNEYSRSLNPLWFDSPQLSEVESYCNPDVLTADWQTYRNEEYGFELKHPEDWEVEVLESRPAPGFVLGSSSDDMDSNILIVPRGEYDYGLDGEKIEKDISFAGKNAVETSWENFSIETLHIKDSVDNWTGDNRIEIRARNELTDQILSTFRFIQ